MATTETTEHFLIQRAKQYPPANLSQRLFAMAIGTIQAQVAPVSIYTDTQIVANVRETLATLEEALKIAQGRQP